MQTIDYGRSCLRGTAAGNSPRFWIESRTRLIDEKLGTEQTWYQCASCKSEDTFARQDLFYPINYDFLPVFTDGCTVIFRRFSFVGAQKRKYREIHPGPGPWGKSVYHLVEPRSFKLLQTPAEIRAATHGYQPLVAQTEYDNPQTQMRAILECPIKTMNIRPEGDLYQVDTGPIAFFDLSQRRDSWAEAMSLAFIAFNALHFADVILEAPTPVIRDGAELCQVHHYSDIRTVEAQNRIYAIA